MRCWEAAKIFELCKVGREVEKVGNGCSICTIECISIDPEKKNNSKPCDKIVYTVSAL